MRVLSRRCVVVLAGVAAVLAGSSWTPAAAAGHPRPGPPRAGVGFAGSGWPQFGFSAARTSDNPFESVLGPGNVAGLRQKWSFLAGEFATPYGVQATPVVANGVVYDSASEVTGTLYALNATTGHKLASFPLGTATISPAVVAGGTVYIGGFDQRLHAYALSKP